MSTIDDLLNAKKISDIRTAPSDQSGSSNSATSQNDDSSKGPHKIKVFSFDDDQSKDSPEPAPPSEDPKDTGSVLDDFEIKDTESGNHDTETESSEPKKDIPEEHLVEEEPQIDDFVIKEAIVEPESEEVEVQEKKLDPQKDSLKNTIKEGNSNGDFSNLLDFYDSENIQEIDKQETKKETVQSEVDSVEPEEISEDKKEKIEEAVVGGFPDKVHEWQSNNHHNQKEEKKDLQATKETLEANKELETKHDSLSFGDSETILDDKMKEIDFKEKEQQVEARALSLGFGYINFKGVPIAAENLQKIPFELSKQKKIVCFYFAAHSHARIAFTEKNIENLDSLKKELPKNFEKVEIEWFLVSEESFGIAYKQYDNLPKIKPTTKGVHIEEEDFLALYESIATLKDIDSQVKNINITQMITLFVAAGVKLGASDIHIEAEIDGIKLRYRIDGILHTASILDRDLWGKVISRIKLLANLKMNVSFEPQDGRFSIFLPEEKIDVRLSSLPTNYGESVVMRLLRSKSINIDFKTIGLSEKYHKMLSREISRPNGMIITTGPTGSGKTTTLYSVLKELNQPEVKIITVEDPIEYELNGVNQSQIDHKKGYTFAKGLRSILRQDPDIVMVGEMRDLETVDIALNAALTGHLVLSTIHANNAAGAVPRFLAMGAKPYLLAPALNLIMAQRLARKLCPECKKEHILSEEEKQKVSQILESLPESEKQKVDFDNLSLFKSEGCSECSNLGYKGRIGLFEMFNMSPEIEKIILSGEVSEYKIAEEAKKDGMISMVQDGVLKALSGVTSLEEVYRVIE
jgi:type II secretory ATPase GspE/PulE/Tfp pilus assembly ATPase PilB-like protein